MSVMDHEIAVEEFALSVYRYCVRFNASVTSWIRSERYNLSVQGVVNSLHLGGLAVDVVYDVPVPLDVRREFCSLLGLRLVPESDHDHLQLLR